MHRAKSHVYFQPKVASELRPLPIGCLSSLALASTSAHVVEWLVHLIEIESKTVHCALSSSLIESQGESSSVASSSSMYVMLR